MERKFSWHTLEDCGDKRHCQGLDRLASPHLFTELSHYVVLGNMELYVDLVGLELTAIHPPLPA